VINAESMRSGLGCQIGGRSVKEPSLLHFISHPEPARALHQEAARADFCWTSDYTARLPAATHRAAASALSSGRVLKAIAAPRAALRIALMTTSNNARCRGGRRTPPPITTQS